MSGERPMTVACILLGGPDRSIVAGGTTYRFEDHPQCGPMLLTSKTGAIATKQPGERDPFWEAVERWYHLGKEVGPDGLCVWWPAPQPVIEHVGGRHWRVASTPPDVRPA